VADQASKRLIPDKDVCSRYGITSKTLWVWTGANFGFPQPVTINGRNFRRESELDAFDAGLTYEKGRAPRQRRNPKHQDGEAA
jgi:predicted DNA-binding transcriptional regulator AlpA